jgi:hypothetical protein
MGSSIIKENPFSKNKTSITAIKEEITLYKIASERNCLISCALVEPLTLRMPTSLNLFAALAVERFIKFTQASRIMNKAILPKM